MVDKCNRDANVIFPFKGIGYNCFNCSFCFFYSAYKSKFLYIVSGIKKMIIFVSDANIGRIYKIGGKMDLFSFLDSIEYDGFPNLWLDGHDYRWNGYFWELIH